MPPSPRNDDISLQLATIAIEAGHLVMDLQARQNQAYTKADGTPTCPADIISETLIVEQLRHVFPDIPIISEEKVQDDTVREKFFLVDPLDGTAEFIGGGREYCVNIALVEAGRPIAAVIAAPALDRIWIAGENALAAHISTLNWRAITTRGAGDTLTALTSSRYGDTETEKVLAELPIQQRRRISSAVKFGIIASGEADLYLRCGRTMEWDTAAGDHILARAGGVTVSQDGQPLTYGRRNDAYANGPFLALGDPDFLTKTRFSDKDIGI